MEDYNFFMNNKLVTAVLCFGGHICNQAARIMVNIRLIILYLCPVMTSCWPDWRTRRPVPRASTRRPSANRTTPPSTLPEKPCLPNGRTQCVFESRLSWDKFVNLIAQIAAVSQQYYYPYRDIKECLFLRRKEATMFAKVVFTLIDINVLLFNAIC